MLKYLIAFWIGVQSNFAASVQNLSDMTALTSPGTNVIMYIVNITTNGSGTRVYTPYKITPSKANLEAIAGAAFGDGVWTNSGGIIQLIGGTNIILNPDVADSGGPIAYIFNSSNILTTGNIIKFANGGTPVTSIDYLGGLHIDNQSGFVPTITISDTAGTATLQSIELQIAPSGVTRLDLRPFAGDGTTPYVFDMGVLHTTGNGLELKNQGTIFDTTAIVSGYTGAGTKVKYDDGTYKTPPAGGVSGSMINTATTVANRLAYSLDTTKTNWAPSGGIVADATTNISIIGLGSADSLLITNTFTLPNSAAPTTTTFGNLAGDNNAWAASHGTLQFYDGTANVYVVATTASDTPTNGQVPQWNTGGTITWESPFSGTVGSMINTATTAIGTVPYALDTTKTNWAPSGGLSIGASTNVQVIGNLTANTVAGTNGVTGSAFTGTGTTADSVVLVPNDAGTFYFGIKAYDTAASNNVIVGPSGGFTGIPYYNTTATSGTNYMNLTNLVIGANLTLTGNSLAAAAGGTVGSMINTTTTAVGTVPYATDTTKTNWAPSGGLSIGASTNVAVIGNVTANGLLATNTATIPALYGSDGTTRLNVPYTVYASGTAYSLTATSAALDFGTTDPSVTIAAAGTYAIRARVNLKYNAATFAAVRTVTLKLRRTNNTAADLTNGSDTILTDIITTKTYTEGWFNLPEVIYTTSNSNDAITIFGDVSVIPTAGSLDAVSASIVAVRLYE